MDGWKDMGRGMRADNGLGPNVWKEERQRWCVVRMALCAEVGQWL